LPALIAIFMLFAIDTLSSINPSIIESIRLKYFISLIDTALPLASILLVSLFASMMKFIKKFNYSLLIRRLFDGRLSPEEIKKLQKKTESFKLNGETRKLTVLCCSIQGFTISSEQCLIDPQLTIVLINKFLSAMSAIIMQNRGMVDKFSENHLIAVFNAPIEIEHQQDSAIKSAVGMLNKLKDLNNELKKENIPPINISIGVTTGDAVAGNMKGIGYIDYSFFGDVINLSTEFKDYADDYGVRILLDHQTVSALGKEWIVIELDYIEIKDKIEKIQIFTIYSYTGVNRPQQVQTAIAQHEKFLEAYRSQRWDRALILGKSLTSAWNSELKNYYKMMIKRIEHLQKYPM